MVKKKLKYNMKGFYAVRKSPKVVKKLEGMAKGIADASNEQAGIQDGYRTSSVQGKKKPQGRWRTTVITATAEAMKDNAENNRLLKNLRKGDS